MPQIDPAAEVRKMYKDHSNAGVGIYDAVAPAGAGVSLPYVVIRSVDAIPIPMRDEAPEYRAIVNLDIFDEYREYGGSLAVDDISTLIMNAMIPTNQSNLPPLTTLSHILSRLIRTTLNTEYIGSVQVFQKRLTVEHFLKLSDQ